MNADDPNRARLGRKAIDAERGGRGIGGGHAAGREKRLIGQIMCLILGVGAGQRPFFMGKVIRIDFPTRTKSVSRY